MKVLRGSSGGCRRNGDDNDITIGMITISDAAAAAAVASESKFILSREDDARGAAATAAVT